MKTFIIILVLYLIYRITKYYFIKKYFRTNNRNSNFQRYSKPSNTKIDEKDIIEAEFEEIEVKKGHSDTNKE